MTLVLAFRKLARIDWDCWSAWSTGTETSFTNISSCSADCVGFDSWEQVYAISSMALQPFRAISLLFSNTSKNLAKSSWTFLMIFSDAGCLDLK